MNQVGMEIPKERMMMVPKNIEAKGGTEKQIGKIPMEIKELNFQKMVQLIGKIKMGIGQNEMIRG